MHHERKIHLARIMVAKIDWDTTPSTSIVNGREEIKSQLFQLNKLTFPRHAVCKLSPLPVYSASDSTLLATLESRVFTFTRNKWKKMTDSLIVGIMVLLKKDHLPSLKWRIRRIIELFPGKDCVFFFFGGFSAYFVS